MSSLDTVRALPGSARDGYKLLCLTIKKGREEEALHLIAIGAEVNFPQKHQHTPLHHAVSQSSHALVSLILSKGSNVNAKGHNNKTPLHLAKSAEIAKVLLNNGALMDVVTSMEGYTPLYQAIVHRQLAVAEVLLERGADVNCLSKKSETALSLAVSAKCGCLIDQVLKYNPDVSITSNRDCIKIGVEQKLYYTNVSQALIEYGIGVNPDPNVFLKAAVWNGYWNIVEQLLLMLKGGCPQTYEFVLSRSILKNAPRITDIILSREDLNFVNNANNVSALSAAVVKLDIEITKKLIAKGADLNRVNWFGGTALHELASEFTDHPMNVSKKVENASREKMAELLISHGAKINARTNEYKTPLHLAAGKGSYTVLEVLLKAKAAVNAKDISGKTPLHVAVLNFNLKAAEILLFNGADINLVNYKQKTALDIICDLKLHRSTKRWQTIAKLLTSHVTLKRAQQLSVSEVCSHDQEAIKELILACENELAKLKIEKIGTSFLSFYNVLMKSEVSFAKCLANIEITKILKSRATKKMFPIYESFLKKQLKNGLARKQLMDQARLNSLTFFRLLPENCFQKIHDNLNAGDLKILVEASCTVIQ